MKMNMEDSDQEASRRGKRDATWKSRDSRRVSESGVIEIVRNRGGSFANVDDAGTEQWPKLNFQMG